MTQSYYNIRANFDSHHYVLTGEGYKDSANHDALSFLSEDAALNEFSSTKAADFIKQGWAGYHTINLIVTEYTVDADGEVTQRIVAEKTVTVDDEAQANAHLIAAARLIAAAPELLAALEYVLDAGYLEGGYAPGIAKVKAAIAKAKGE